MLPQGGGQRLRVLRIFFHGLPVGRRRAKRLEKTKGVPVRVAERPSSLRSGAKGRFKDGRRHPTAQQTPGSWFCCSQPAGAKKVARAWQVPDKTFRLAPFQLSMANRFDPIRKPLPLGLEDIDVGLRLDKLERHQPRKVSRGSLSGATCCPGTTSVRG